MKRPDFLLRTTEMSMTSLRSRIHLFSREWERYSGRLNNLECRSYRTIVQGKGSLLLTRYRGSFVVPCSRSRSSSRSRSCSRSGKAQQNTVGQDSSLLMLNQALASLTRPEPPCQQQLLIVHREQFCSISIKIVNSST